MGGSKKSGLDNGLEDRRIPALLVKLELFAVGEKASICNDWKGDDSTTIATVYPRLNSEDRQYLIEGSGITLGYPRKYHQQSEASARIPFELCFQYQPSFPADP